MNIFDYGLKIEYIPEEDGYWVILRGVSDAKSYVGKGETVLDALCDIAAQKKRERK